MKGHLVACVLGLGLVAGRPAAAVDRFEIQVYEGDINQPDRFGLELHSNLVVQDRSVDGVEAGPRRLWRTTFEPSFGVLPWWELGAYFQVAVAASQPASYFGGFKLRSKFIVPQQATGDFILGLNIELGRGGAALGEADWDTEFRPIIVYLRGPLMFALNPIFGWAVTGAREAAPDFEPAAKARWDTGRGFGVGLEYYAGLGLVTRPLARGEQTHVLYLVADLIDAAFDLNLGLGRSLTSAIDPWTIKLIAGVGF